MNISCQSIINPEKPMQGIIDLRRAEFDGIMLGIAPETIRERYEELINKCRENRIRISAVMAPSLPYKEDGEKNYEAFMRKCAVESIMLCKKAGCN